MKKYSYKLAARDVAQCSLFTALMVAAAFIKIPFPLVPLTFQTAVAVLCGLVLGSKKGIIATSAYLAMGLIGIPVFTSGGGITYVTLPSFGYILGFIASAGVAGLAANKSKKLWQTVAIAICAFLADYAIGIPYFIAVWQLSGYSALWGAVVSYNLLYIPKDALLSVLAAVISRAVLPAIKPRKKQMPAKEE